MSNHKTRIVGSYEAWQGKCSCKAKSSVSKYRWEAEDWISTHLTQVQQARVHLMSRNPSLKDQRNWYQKQADRTDLSPEEREQWQQMATALDHRIGKPPEDTPLF